MVIDPAGLRSTASASCEPPLGVVEEERGVVIEGGRLVGSQHRDHRAEVERSPEVDQLADRGLRRSHRRAAPVRRRRSGAKARRPPSRAPSATVYHRLTYQRPSAFDGDQRALGRRARRSGPSRPPSAASSSDPTLSRTRPPNSAVGPAVEAVAVPPSATDVTPGPSTEGVRTRSAKSMLSSSNDPSSMLRIEDLQPLELAEQLDRRVDRGSPARRARSARRRSEPVPGVDRGRAASCTAPSGESAPPAAPEAAHHGQPGGEQAHHDGHDGELARRSGPTRPCAAPGSRRNSTSTTSGARHAAARRAGRSTRCASGRAQAGSRGAHGLSVTARSSGADQNPSRHRDDGEPADGPGLRTSIDT